MVHSLFNKEMQSTSSALSRQQRCEAAVISYEDAMLWCRLGICHLGESESKSYEQPTLFRVVTNPLFLWRQESQVLAPTCQAPVYIFVDTEHKVIGQSEFTSHVPPAWEEKNKTHAGRS